ncbi:MAG: HAD-IC family P-type ATPase, partial [Eudoraea sp.]|nr:HAD-IC family P-type ATPase [Eudoraea sp.]
MAKTIKNPHVLSAKEVVHKLDSNYAGLSTKKAEDRLKIYGPNELPESKSISPFLLLLKQFKNWLVIILIFAAAISWLTGHIVDTWVIITVIVINAGIGFSQEYRAEKAITSLKKLIVKTAKVFRDGELGTLPSSQLVLGDIIVLEDGDSIPADARIIQSKNLRTIEASLTGESLPVSKKKAKQAIDTPMADQKNMVWNGTFVARGYAKAIVTGTGMDTAIGSISETLSHIEEGRTSFNKKTDVLAKQMSVIAISSAFLMFLIGYFYRDFEIEEILITSIALLVAAIPEGLPAVISIVLAIGAHRMAKRNAIVREFTATETLGAVTAILTDKTGTLTQNSLTSRKVFIPGESEYTVTGEGWFPVGNFMKGNTIIDPKKNDVLQKLLKIAAISNNSELRHDKEANTYELIGDPTEGALSVLAKKGGVQTKYFQKQKIDDLPFDSNIKLRATLLKEKNHQELHVTGA